MYAQRCNTNNRNNGFKTPTPAKAMCAYKCKVCFDSGKPATLYNNHYVRETPDVNSRVVCPTLLSMICSYCHKKGHTPSRCMKRERDEAMSSTGSTTSCCETASVSSWGSNSTMNSSIATPKKNLYSMLCMEADDSDDEEDNDSIPSLDWMPEQRSCVGRHSVAGGSLLPRATDTIQTDEKKSNYLMALLKTPPAPVQTTNERVREVFRGMKFNRNWADFSDSDSDEE
jgi:Nanos RNA binding domain